MQISNGHNVMLVCFEFREHRRRGFSVHNIQSMLKFKPENNTNCMDARPEAETLLVTGDGCIEVMDRVLNWPTEGVN